MGPQYLPEPYGDFLRGAKKNIRSVGQTLELQILGQGSALSSKSIAALRLYQAELEGEVDQEVESLLDNVSIVRDAAFNAEVSAHGDSFGATTREERNAIEHKHIGAYERICREIERYAAMVMNQVLLVFYGYLKDDEVDQLRQHPMRMRIGSQHKTFTMEPKTTIDGYVIFFAIALLLFSLAHAGVVLWAMPELSIGHSITFLVINLTVMLVRLTDLVLTKRNGTFEKAMHGIEVLVSATLILLLVLHCIPMVVADQSLTTWLKCIGEFLVGLIVVLAFHRMVAVVITRLRDWIDRGKRRW